MIEKLKKEEWEWFWSGNWPLFDQTPYFSRGYAKEWENIIKKGTEILAVFYNKGIATIYHSKRDLKELEKNLLTQYKKNPDFLITSLSDYDARINKNFKAIREIVRKDFGKLSNKELVHDFIEARKNFVYNAFIDHYDYFLERYFTPLLEEWVKQKLVKQNMKEAAQDSISEIVTLLITPQKKTPVAKEREAFKNIIDKIKRNKSLVKEIKKGADHTILKNHPTLKKEFDSHVKRHSYLIVVVNAKPYTKEDFWKDVKRFVGKGEKFKVEAKRLGDDYNKSTIRKAKRIEKKLDPDKKTKLLIKGIRGAVYLRTIDNAVQGKLTMLFKPFCEEMAKRLGITYSDLKYLTEKEIIEGLKNSKKVKKTLVQKRLGVTSYIKYHGRNEVNTGKKAYFIKSIIESHSGKKGLTKFSGIAASKGIVKGKARVANNLNDAEDIQKGEILVTPSTSAYFVPSLRKAAGIVTEYHGLTNHAVVVARENRVPCITGVKNITKHIKTGDIIEINSNTGTIIKR